MTAILELGDAVDREIMKMEAQFGGALAATRGATYVPDVSEFQPNVNFAEANQWTGGACIIRAAYGVAHLDRSWYGGARRDAFWKNGGKVLGIYQYLVAGQDAAAQAYALIKIVGTLRPGEFIVCDLEEGSGDQLHRFLTWKSIIDAHLHYPGSTGAWLYSGEYFTKNHDLLSVARSKTHMWLAAYQSTEPTDVPHTLWQFKDNASVPGIGGGVDLSVFHGSVSQLHALVVTGGAPRPPAKPKPPVHKPPKPVVNRTQIRSVQAALGISQDGFWWHKTDSRFLAERARCFKHYGRDTHVVIGLENAVHIRADGDWGPIADRSLLALRAAVLNK